MKFNALVVFMYPPEVIHMKFLMAAIPIIEIRIVLSLFRGVVAVLWNPKKKTKASTKTRQTQCSLSKKGD